MRGERPDEGQVAVLLRVVQPVADDEFVGGDVEADPLAVERDLGRVRLAQQGADLQRGGSREPRFDISQDSVRPESMMSSTIRTCLPLMSVSRSLRMRTTPEDWVPAPYEETAIQSMVTGGWTARAPGPP